MKSFLEFSESVVPAHMQGKQKPYVSSDGKGNYEVLGSKGQTKATFTRAEHGKDAHVKAQKHLKSKYDEYMKEEVELDEAELSAKQKKIAGLSHPKDKIDAADMKKLRGEEVEIDEASDKAEMLRAALARHSEKAMAANKAGNDDAVKVHQNYMNKIKDKMAKLARNEEVELDEEELDEGRMKDIVTNKQEDERLAKLKKEMVGKITIGEEEVEEATIAGTSGWEKIKKDVKDKSGAVHSPMSRARDLARQALKNVKLKKEAMDPEAKFDYEAWRKSGKTSTPKHFGPKGAGTELAKQIKQSVKDKKEVKGE